MKKYLAIFALGCLFFTQGLAQSSWKFKSVEYVGMLTGESGKYGQFQTINGAANKSWFVGLGLGLDYYRFRSLPIFLSVTRELRPAKKNGLFLTLDAGYNYAVYHRPGSYYSPGFITSEFNPGPYWNAGLGYRYNISTIHRNRALLAMVGYSYKELKEDAKTYPESTFDYRNRRWSFKIGIAL
ncbi:MAG TPA: hypothetical protein VL832_20015 [Puia sp.]|jgi:hypothetical protein|nr:hypothetical protein [Puia sp.]